MGIRHFSMGDGYSTAGHTMIALPLAWLVFICLLVFLSGIFSVWISYELLRRKRLRHRLLHRLRCGVCCMEFADSSQSELATCPRCGSLNERVRPQDFL